MAIIVTKVMSSTGYAIEPIFWSRSPLLLALLFQSNQKLIGVLIRLNDRAYSNSSGVNSLPLILGSLVIGSKSLLIL